MARDPDTIQREIEEAQVALGGTIDELLERANPKHLIESGRQSVQAKLADPRLTYAAIGVGALVVLFVVRKLFR